MDEYVVFLHYYVAHEKHTLEKRVHREVQKKRRRIKRKKRKKKQDEESYNNVFTVKTQFSLQYLQILSQSEHVWKSISMYVVRQFI